MPSLSIRAFTPALLCALAGAANAQTISEDAKLTASDAATNDNFGGAIAIFGSTAIIGANGDSDAGTATGSAYLFDISDRSNPVEQFKLTASDGAAFDAFGDSVAIGGNIAIVGSIGDDDAGTTQNTNSGSAYLFDTATGQQLAKLTASDAAPVDFFGNSVAISGTIAMVAAYYDDDDGENSGSVYLFDISEASNPVEIHKLTASDAGPGDWFGSSVSASGNLVVVGAQFDNDAGDGSGSVYVFDISNPSNPIERSKLIASDAAPGDRFGISVAISGTTVVVGARENDDAGSSSGSAYVFDVSDPSNPVERFKLTASDATAGDRFGNAVGVSGSTAVIGAYTDGDTLIRSGSAYLFDTTTGEQLFKLASSDAAADDLFGSAVAISADAVGVGAYLDDHSGLNSSGSVYLFEAPASPCPADVTGDENLNFFDVAAYIALYNANDPAADLAAPFGTLNFFDLAAYIASYNAGCP